MLNHAPLKDTTRGDEMKVFFLSELHLYVILESKFVIFLIGMFFICYSLATYSTCWHIFSVTAAAHEPNASSPTPVGDGAAIQDAALSAGALWCSSPHTVTRQARPKKWLGPCKGINGPPQIYSYLHDVCALCPTKTHAERLCCN